MHSKPEGVGTMKKEMDRGGSNFKSEEEKKEAKKKVTGVEEDDNKDDLVHIQRTANKNEAKSNVFEGNSKILQNKVNVKIVWDIQQKQAVEWGKMKLTKPVPMPEEITTGRMVFSAEGDTVKLDKLVED